MKTYISPKYTADYLSDDSIDKKIDVLEDRVNGWFLDWADELNNNKPHAGFAVLHLAFSYFEFIAIFINGEDSNSKSKDFFKKGFLNVFPELNNEPIDTIDNLLNIIYKNARCGFFHSGMAKKGILLLDHESSISFHNGNIFFDRYKFVNTIRYHFSKYIENLRNDDDLRCKFLNAWNIVNS